MCFWLASRAVSNKESHKPTVVEFSAAVRTLFKIFAEVVQQCSTDVVIEEFLGFLDHLRFELWKLPCLFHQFELNSSLI